MNLKELRAANIARNSIWDPKGLLDLDFSINELGGELGEACNCIKKLARIEYNIRGSTATTTQLAEELADVAICTDLAAWRAAHPILLLEHQDVPKEWKISARGCYLLHRLSDIVENPQDNYGFDALLTAAALVAKSFGIDLLLSIEQKFNATSTKYNLPIFIGTEHV